ncbi:MAG TPA: hypothetical protein V6C76_11745 [Drouetiella sp.]
MPIISNDQNFNPNSLNVPDLYVVIKKPPGFIKGIPTSSAWVEGTASWGAMNVPTLMGGIDDLASTFGGVTADSFNDPYDLPTAAQVAFAQADQQNGLTVYGNRIGDGTETAAAYSIPDTTSGTPLLGFKLSGKYKGTLGNGIVATVAESSTKTGCFNLTISHPILGAERFANIPGGEAGVFSNAAIAAINNGQGTLRAKSQIVTASSLTATNTSLDPAVGQYQLQGGTDGRNVGSSNFIGDPTLDPPTGIYTLNTLDDPPSVAWCAGLTDSEVFSDIQAQMDSLAIVGLLTVPIGTDVPTAINLAKTLGIDSPNVAYCKDWVYWYDTTAGAQRLVDPAAFIGGRLAALAPAQSPLNKAVNQVIGTERMNADSGMKRYTPAQIGQLSDAGFLFISNPVPGGKYWGIRTGNNTCSDLVRKVVEYARETNYLAHSFDATMGKAVGQLQSTDPADSLRQLVKLELDTFLATEKKNKQIDNFLTVCDLTNNDPTVIATHFMTADVYVRYMSSVLYFLINLQGGTTVSISATTITEEQAQQVGV